MSRHLLPYAFARHHRLLLLDESGQRTLHFGNGLQLGQGGFGLGAVADVQRALARCVEQQQPV